MLLRRSSCMFGLRSPFTKLFRVAVCHQRYRFPVCALSWAHMRSRISRFSSSAPTQRPHSTTKKPMQVHGRSRKKAQLSKPPSTSDEQALIDSMQGEWGDDIGLGITISGRQAKFTDGPSIYKFEETNDGLVLRGAKLIGTPQYPIWKFPWGVERRWARLKPQGIGDETWLKAFHHYKSERLLLRKQLHEAIVNHDFERMSSLRAAWDSKTGNAGNLTNTQEEMLDLGSRLVTGVCVRHKLFGYRGVLIASEPWCIAPVHWRAQMGVPALPRGEAQPFYHCIVDTRDRSGGQITFCSEENIEPSDVAFPIESPLLDDLLQTSNEIGGYLPTAKLEAALWKQRTGSRFEL